MDMENMWTFLEKVAEGTTEVKISQDEMKTRLSDEIKSVQAEMKEELKGMSAAQDTKKKS